MRRFFLLGLLMSVVWMYSAGVSAQAPKADSKMDLKGDPKKDVKDDPKKEPTREWPKEIMGKNLDYWVKQMVASNQRDASVRELAVHTVPLFGPDCRKAASANLIVALKDADVNVRLAAIAQIPVIGFDREHEDAGLNALVDIINPAVIASQVHTRYEATMAIGNCGPIASRAIPILTKFTIRDPGSWKNRKAAAFALGQIGLPFDVDKEAGPDLVAIRALILCLTTEHCLQVRQEAVNSVLRLGPPLSEPDWIELRKALKYTVTSSTDHGLSLWARVAYIRIEKNHIKPNDPNLTAIAKSLSSKEALQKNEALQALAVLGDEARSRVSDIIAFATTTSPKPDDVLLAASAIWALGNMPAETSRILPVLEGLSKHKNEGIQQAANIATNMLKLQKSKPKLESKVDPKKKN